MTRTGNTQVSGWRTGEEGHLGLPCLVIKRRRISGKGEEEGWKTEKKKYVNKVLRSIQGDNCKRKYKNVNEQVVKLKCVRVAALYSGTQLSFLDSWISQEYRALILGHRGIVIFCYNLPFPSFISNVCIDQLLHKDEQLCCAPPVWLSLKPRPVNSWPGTTLTTTPWRRISRWSTQTETYPTTKASRVKQVGSFSIKKNSNGYWQNLHQPI